jgi:hypothetical protein
MKYFLWILFIMILIQVGCKGGHTLPVIPQNDTTPPVWDNTIGIINALPVEDGITVYWGTATDEESPPVVYLVYKDVDDNPWDRIPVLMQTNDPYTFTGLPEEQIYWFGVRCMDSANPSNMDSNAVVIPAYKGTPDGGDRWPPIWDYTIGITLAEPGDKKVTVHWGTATDIHTPPVKYRVYLDTDTYPFDQNFVSLPDNDPFVFTGLENGKKYWFGVRCLDSVDPPNVDSNVVVLSAVPVDDGIDDDPPVWDTTTGVVSLDCGDARITAHWGTATDEETPPVDYVVFLDTDSDPWDKTPVILPANDPYTFTGLDNGQQYWVGVRCQDSWNPPNRDSNTVVMHTSPGSETWVRTWGGTYHDWGTEVVVDKSGNLFVAGQFERTVDFNPGKGVEEHSVDGAEYDVYLSKFDNDGNFKWVITWGAHNQPMADPRDEISGLEVDESGNVYVTGNYGLNVDFDPGSEVCELPSNGGSDIFLSKFDTNGNFIWARTWGGEGNDYAVGSGIDASGNVFVTGAFYGPVDFDPTGGYDEHISFFYPDSGGDAFISKIDKDGNFIWAKTWGGDNSDTAFDAAADTLNNVYITGQYQWNSCDFDPGPGVDFHTYQENGDVYLLKLDSNGNFEWCKTWGGYLQDFGMKIVIDDLNNAYVAGTIEYEVDMDPGPGYDMHFTVWNGSCWAVFCSLSKFNSNGDFQWAESWGGDATNWPHGLATDGETNVYVTGTFWGNGDLDPGPGEQLYNSNDWYDDIFLSEFDLDGHLISARTWDSAEEDRGRSLAIDNSGYVYLSGFFGLTVDFDQGSGPDERSSNGLSDAFIMKLKP